MATRYFTDLTLKRLYSRSGNCCAYPGCTVKLIDQSNISDICHIEALNPGGPRYNDDPDITDKDRNDHPNLILLCKNHHHIIDDKDEAGNPLYSTAQLKAMKQAHEDEMENLRDSWFRQNAPSLLGKIIRKLSEFEDANDSPSPKPLSFEITEKISFNAVERHVWMIEKYSAYFGVVDMMYNELESGPMKKVLNSIQDCYLANRRPGASADDTLDRVQSVLVERLQAEAVLEYSEDLETCVRIIVVDGFMRCKILEEPKP
jgi:hypothetical protein